MLVRTLTFALLQPGVAPLSPLPLTCEDRMEKDKLLRSAQVSGARAGHSLAELAKRRVGFPQEQAPGLRAPAEEALGENERLRHDVTRMGGASQEDWSETD